ncbi:polysaccharide deacetylase family protein [Patescibacteria group bacterium]
MANYQQYQQYRLQRQSSRSRKWRWVIIIAIIIIFIWWLRNSVSNDTEEANVNTADNTNAAEEVTDDNINTNSTPDVNLVSSFDLDTCTRSISRGNSEAANINLTFNSVSSAGTTDQILEILTNKEIKADFFVTGVWLENNGELGKQILEKGHGIYSLGYEYESFTTKTDAEVQSDLEKTDDIFNSALEQSAKPFFRPPFGSINDEIFTAVKQYGYCPIVWTFDSLDWSADLSSEEVKQRILEKATNGAIIVMQTSNSVVPEILNEVIDSLKENSLNFVSLIELVNQRGE